MIYEPEFSYDSLIKEWDALLFGFNLHEYWFKVMPGRFWAELLHLLYLANYPLLIGSFLWICTKRPSDLPCFPFVYLGIFITFNLIFILFPVYGPTEYRGNQFNHIFFSRVIDLFFALGESNGGAFPSSHVGQSIGIYLIHRLMSRPVRLLVGIIIGLSSGRT